MLNMSDSVTAVKTERRCAPKWDSREMKLLYQAYFREKKFGQGGKKVTTHHFLDFLMFFLFF